MQMLTRGMAKSLQGVHEKKITGADRCPANMNRRFRKKKENGNDPQIGRN